MIRLSLPYPPTLNNLFVNVPGRGRVPSKGYLAWRDRAAERLWFNRCKPIIGPVDIEITLEERSNRDLDNCAKGILDFMVHHRLIEDDRARIVRKITLMWGDVDGALVVVTPHGATTD